MKPNTPSNTDKGHDPKAGPACSEDGVDLTLIRWMLSLSPAERLQVLQSFVDLIEAVRENNG